MRKEEARLYLEHTSKEDFNLEEWQKENRYQAIQVVLKEIERLNNIIDKKEQFLGDNIKRLEREVIKRDNIINELEKWLKERSGDVSFAYHHTLNKLQELKGSDKE